MHRTDLEKTTQYEGDINCTILEGPPGSGKTTAMLAEIARTPSRYLLAAPRTDLCDEHAMRLQDHDVPEVLVIHSDQSVRGDIDRRLREALKRTDPHLVVVCTHTALMGLDRADVDGWHVRLDELPEGAVTADTIGLAASWPSMSVRYSLVPTAEEGWSRLTCRPEAVDLGLGQLAADVGADLLPLHRIAGSRGRTVEVRLADWPDAAVGNQQIPWRSLWSFAALRGCASLVVTAASYRGSIAEHAVARDGGVQVTFSPVGAARKGQPQIRIHWYATHDGSTSWWDTETGSYCLVQISRHLEAIAFSGYWTSNDKMRPYFAHRFPGTKCSPRVAGTNSLRHHEACAIIYSAKATPSDGAIIDVFQISDDVICENREDEDIYQFATRGIIREHDYAGPYDVYVYNRSQADRLRARLMRAGYTDVVTVSVPEAGILDIERPTLQRGGAVDVDIETATERDARKREKEAARGQRRRAASKAKKIAEGCYVPPGRQSRGRGGK